MADDDEKQNPDTSPETSSESEAPWDAGLSDKHRLFLLYLCTDQDCFLCGTRAYKKAYVKKVEVKRRGKIHYEMQEPDDESARASAARLLQNVSIITAKRKLLLLAQNQTDEDAVYKALAITRHLAFFNPLDVINEKGDLATKTLAELGDMALCIREIEKNVDRNGRKYTKVRLVDRYKYMRLYGEYLRIVRPENQERGYTPTVLMPEKMAEDAWNQCSLVKAGSEDDINTEGMNRD